MTKEQSAVLIELAEVKVLFQARALAAVMGLPQPTRISQPREAKETSCDE